MKKPKFSLTPVVRVEIKHDDSENPLLIQNFFKFIIEEGILPSHGQSDGSALDYTGYYTGANAEKIEKWLKEQKGI